MMTGILGVILGVTTTSRPLIMVEVTTTSHHPRMITGILEVTTMNHPLIMVEVTIMSHHPRMMTGILGVTTTSHHLIMVEVTTTHPRQSRTVLRIHQANTVVQEQNGMQTSISALSLTRAF